METPEHIRTQKFVGGNLALDLLNTGSDPADGTPEHDVLRSYSDLVAWSHAAGALTEVEADRLLHAARRHPAAARKALESVRATRIYLYRLFDAIADGHEPSEESVGRLERDEAEALRHARLVARDGTYSWTWEPESGEIDLARPVWQVIHAATTLLTNGPLDRVKACESCRFHFIDESRNRSRRWCSMDDCGTRVKVRRYVERRAARKSEARA
jgi:predicted RNA-binding Zn ribbon-like protein